MNSAHLLHEAVLENLGEALIIINARGQIERFTHAAERLFLYQRNEVIGKNVSMLMPKDIGNIHQGYVDGYHSTERSTVLGRTRELVALRKDGTQFPVEITVTRVLLEDRTIFVGLLKDVTEKVNTIEQLNHALKQANVANDAKSEFLENMCHEVRTPMNGVLGTLQLLNTMETSPEAKRLIDVALSSSELLLRLLNDVLDFSKIDADKLRLEITEFCVRDTLEDVCDSMRQLASEKGLDINVTYGIDTEDTRLGDALRIKQILSNIVSNAIKFSEVGPIDLEVTATSQKVDFKVTDKGIGMSEAQCKTLFERFSQGDTSTTRKYGGTGLGMAIVSQLVSLMEGEIRVRSQLGQGTTLHVSLPLKRVEKTETSSTASIINNCPNLIGRTILIADDNEMNLLVTREMLKETNATIAQEVNGQEAVNFCETHSVDIVLMDINMPQMDGKTALKILRQKGFTNTVVALTASAGVSQVEEYRRLGFNDVLPKPISIAALYDFLRDYEN